MTPQQHTEAQLIEVRLKSLYRHRPMRGWLSFKSRKVREWFRRVCKLPDIPQLVDGYYPTKRQKLIASVSRRTLVAGFTCVATAAAADTPFTTFSFPRALPSGTGTTPNSQTAPVRDGVKVNVRDFGATGNGSTDDTAAIQAAVNWTTSTTARGTVYFPTGSYKATSFSVPPGASIVLTGDGNSSSIVGNFNGFIVDNLSTPYNAAGAPFVIENLNIANTFAGNNWNVTANGTWSASGSPTVITLSGSNPGVVAGAILFTNDQRASANVQLIGPVTSVSWPNITVSSAAVGSGATSNLVIQAVQAYAAGASWSNNASTITMGSSAPTGISGQGQFYVWNYSQFLANPLFQFCLGVGIWSGTTLTLTAGTGSVGASIGAADLLVFAPVAGALRLSSVVGATIRNCNLSGYIGITGSEDKIVANDPTVGAAEGFHISVDTCNLSPATGAGAVGQTGIYFQNNSIIKNCNFNSWWCAIRMSGTAVEVDGGRAEVCYFGIIIGGDGTATNNSFTDGKISNMSMESNLIGLMVYSATNTVIEGLGIANNAQNPLYGMYFTGGGVGRTSIIGSSVDGHYGSSYGIYIGDWGNNAGGLTFVSCSGVNIDTGSKGWRTPAQAWWGTCIQCDNPALEYTFANLPTGSGSPTPNEGDTYDISDCNTSTFLATAAAGGTGAAAHRRVRYNATSTVWQVIG